MQKRIWIFPPRSKPEKKTAARLSATKRYANGRRKRHLQKYPDAIFRRCYRATEMLEEITKEQPRVKFTRALELKLFKPRVGRRSKNTIERRAKRYR